LERKIVYALAVAVVVVVVVIVSAYVLMNGGGGGAAEDTYTVGNATSLQFNDAVTFGSTQVMHTISAKNVNASNMMLRIDTPGGESGNYTYVLNQGTQTAWQCVNGTWTDVSNDFTNQWNTWVGEHKLWTTDVSHLISDWSGTGNCTYVGSTSGGTHNIYNVVINPTLADSLFEHSP
jgi:hypothetical protein